MELHTGQSVLLIVCIGLMLAQVLVKKKQAIHLVFAIFCGSMAMITAYRMVGDSWGAYQFLLGIGACATCNGYWLVARALFRKKSAIELPHILFTALVAILLIMNQGLGFVEYTWQDSGFSLVGLKGFTSETIGLLSSCMIVMSFWEGCRGYKQTKGTERWHRRLYIGAYFYSVSSVLLFSQMLPAEFLAAGAKGWLIVCASLTMVLMTQYLLWYRSKVAKRVAEQTKSTGIKGLSSSLIDAHQSTSNGALLADQLLCDSLLELLKQQKAYLQPNLRVVDLAQQLDVPEYRIREVMKQQFGAKNFNHYVNQLRIEHAKTLLLDAKSQDWSVLVIGLESGFASVGPFSRAFKQFTGLTPGQYRKQHSEENEIRELEAISF